jgi:outer membrane protein assembly factor BamE (lipoprotein component of BamABCDE complex)
MRLFTLLSLLFLVGCSGKPSEPSEVDAGRPIERPIPVEEPKTDKKVYSLEEFKALVMGKTQDEILELLGKPASMSDNRGPNGGQWFYHDITKDPATNKIDANIRIRFEKGKVASVLVIL